MTKYTELSKKEQGAIRYAKQQARYKEQQANKTQPSDRRQPPDLTRGISGKSQPQTEFVSKFPPGTIKRPKALSKEQFKQILDKLFPSK